MNGACQTPEPTLCGCCEGVAAETPQPVTNRPALSAVPCRVGTWAEFKASLLAALSAPANRALAPLTTRDDSDFTIALLDAWAVTLDILTFYNERLANETYLRTAVTQRSVFELARLVGYRPSPGVAASAFIAFTLNDAPGSPDRVLIPAATRVQSVPAPGQTPAVFETSGDLTALISYNAIPARTTVPWALSAGDTAATFAGTALKVNPGDGLLFIDAELHSTLKTGVADFHLTTAAEVNAAAGTTTIRWDQPLAAAIGADNTGAFVYVFRKKAALYGAQSPDPRVLYGNGSNQYFKDHQNSDWTFEYKDGSLQINLDAVYPDLAPAKNGEPKWVTFVAPGGIALFQIVGAAETAPMLYTLNTRTTQLTLALGMVLINMVLFAAFVAALAALIRLEVAILSGNPSAIAEAMADYASALATFLFLLNNPPTPDQVASAVVDQTRSTAAYIQSELLPPADPPFLGPWTLFTRQSGVLKPVAGANLEITGASQLSAGRPVAVSGRRLRLEVTTGANASFVPAGSTGALTVSDGQVFLIDAFPPRNSVWSVLTLDGVAGALTTAAGNLTLLPAGPKDALASEAAVINRTTVSGPVTILSFDQPLRRIYDRASVTVNANTVASTHGETTHELLGSGDAANPALQFTLKQSPLTYTSAASAQGAQSTLQVWVNNLQWHEQENFLTSGPADRVFVTTAGADGNAAVQFGDGITGARTPTGQVNIRAVYRKGIGLSGMVQAGQLSQALDRPQGLKGAVNPDPASGGADPDTADAARTAAPLHTLTLDRVVSLQDYLNFARAFAGIAKALATWTWFGSTRGVFLTVAGAGGATFQAGDPAVVNLTTALRQSGNPFIPLMVASYTPVLFDIGASIQVDAINYDPADVLARVWQALLAAFSFDARDLGEGVAQSEVIAVIQRNPGVVAVELTAFGRSGDPPQSPLRAVLRAASPIAGGNTAPQPAELLTLDPASRGSLGVWS